MSEISELLKKIKIKTADWSDFSNFLDFKGAEADLNEVFNLARELTIKNFGKILKIYIPNTRFPAISVTGKVCALECEHCNKKYLESMKPILNSDELEKFLLDLSENDGVGVLLSGGCEPNGSVPLFNFLDTIKKVKKRTNLIINTHTGLLDEETAKKLAEAKVDIVSFDINIDEDILKNIYHLDKTLKDYEKAVRILKQYGLNIVPHICIGLYYGKLHKELDSIKFIKDFIINPSLIVLIALIPPKNAKKKFERPLPIDIGKVIAVIRFLFPTTEISLGCMRPRGDIKIEIEKYAIKAGITRIEIPSKKTLEWTKKDNPNIEFKFYSACCAIPDKYEEFVKSKDNDLKRYLKDI